MTARRRFYTDNTYRCCSRCYKELTDPASRECGVGPVCRKKDNHLYAKTIEANIPMASALILGIHSEQLPPETASRWEILQESFTEKMERVQSQNDDYTQFKLTGADFREEVRTIDFALSHSVDRGLRTQLVNVVRHLGYPGLAGVLGGESSKSKAQVWFENGRILLTGTGCTPGFHKMRKIPGISVPQRRGDRKPYSAPANQAVRFLEVVQEHWPLYEAKDGDIEPIDLISRLTIETSQWVKDNPEPVRETYSGPVATITMRTEDFVLAFPWVDGVDMRGMIAKLKRIPSKERGFNPSTKNWMFRKQHLASVKSICSEYYSKTITLDAGAVTVASEWVKTNPYRNARNYGRGRGYRRGYHGGRGW